MATTLRELIDNVNADDLPTNEFTIEDKDPMVILGKMNEIIAYLETLAETIDASDTKATQALAKSIEALTKASTALETALGIDGKATQALSNSLQALESANEALADAGIALSTANTALSTSNTALSTANSAEETAEEAVETAESAETKADTAISTANGAKSTAEGIDAKATQALTNSSEAIETADEAKEIAEEALEQVVTQAGTKVYVNNVLQSTFNADTKADLTRVQTLESDVGTLETNVESLQTDVESLESDVEDINNVINGILSKDRTQDTEIQALDTRITSQATQIAGAIAVNNTQNGRLDTHDTMLEDISDEIETQQTSITNLNTNLQQYWTKIYPIGSIYLSITNTSPASIVGGSWEALDEGYALWTTKTTGTGGNTISAGLPNITGTTSFKNYGTGTYRLTGAFYEDSGNVSHFLSSGAQNAGSGMLGFNANNSNSIYGNSNTVQPPAIKVFAWKRTA